jgi:hypothetical protein
VFEQKLIGRQVGALDRRKFKLAFLLLVLAVALALASNIVLANSPSTKGIVVRVQGDNPVYVDNGASIPIKWGTVHTGENTRTVTITNNAKVNFNTHLSTTNLPEGWTLTFSLNNHPVSPGKAVTGTLILTVPSHAAIGNYHWGARLLFSSK